MREKLKKIGHPGTISRVVGDGVDAVCERGFKFRVDNRGGIGDEDAGVGVGG